MYEQLDPGPGNDPKDVYSKLFMEKIASMLSCLYGGPWDVIGASHMYSALLTGKRTIIVCCHSDGGPSFTLIMSSPNGCTKHLIDRKARQT